MKKILICALGILAFMGMSSALADNSCTVTIQAYGTGSGSWSWKPGTTVNLECVSADGKTFKPLSPNVVQVPYYNDKTAHTIATVTVPDCTKGNRIVFHGTPGPGVGVTSYPGFIYTTQCDIALSGNSTVVVGSDDAGTDKLVNYSPQLSGYIPAACPAS